MVNYIDRKWQRKKSAELADTGCKQRIDDEDMVEKSGARQSWSWLLVLKRLELGIGNTNGPWQRFDPTLLFNSPHV